MPLSSKNITKHIFKIFNPSAVSNFLIIFSLSVLTLYPSFKLAIFGDDWLAFWRYLQHLGPGSSGPWNHLTYYLTPYGAQDILMGLLRNLYGLNSKLYYLTSFSLRLTAALSLYQLVFYLTKNRMSAFTASLFFSITSIGLDTTNWVFNMPTYITITFFNLSLLFLFKSRYEEKRLSLLVSGLLYYFAYVTTPIRMHGSLLLIFLLEIFYLIRAPKLISIKKAIVRLSIFILVFIIIRSTGHSMGPPQEAQERLLLGFTESIKLISANRFDFILSPMLTLGSMVVPYNILPEAKQVISKSQILKLLLPIFMAYGMVVFFLIKLIPKIQKQLFKIGVPLSLLMFLTVVLNNQINRTHFLNSNQVFLVLVGGLTIIIGIVLLTTYINNRNLTDALIISFIWPVLSFFFAWWWVPTTVYLTTHRYLVVSAIGISILVATLINLPDSYKRRLQLFVALLLLVLIPHILSTRLYLNELLQIRTQHISDKIWQSIPHIPEVGKSKEPIVFYFEGDGTNGSILHNVITFGFPPHMALIYNLREGEGIPVPMTDWKEVVSAVSDGKAFFAYGYPLKPIPDERIYAFKLYDKDNLVNITHEVREKLKAYVKN